MQTKSMPETDKSAAESAPSDRQPSKPAKQAEPARDKPANNGEPKEVTVARGKRRTIEPDIPVDEINKLIAERGAVDVMFRIMRRTANGQLSSVNPRVMRNIRELLSGEFELWLQSYSGGGNYEIQTRDPAEDEEILPRFRIVLSGHPIEPRRSPVAGAGYAPAPVTTSPGYEIGALPAGVPRPQLGPSGWSLPPQQDLPAWSRSLPAQQQWPLYYQRLQDTGRLPQGASIHSDAMAMGFNQQLHTQMAAERAENAKLRERLDALSQQLARQQAERARAEGESRIKGLEQQIQALRDAPRAADWGQIAAIVSAAAPIAKAWLENGKSAALTQLKLGQEQQQAVLKAVTAKPGALEAIIAAAPTLLPVAAKVLEMFGPTARAEATNASLETQMIMLRMVQEMVRDQAGPEPPAWYPVVQSILESIGKALGDGKAAGLVERARGGLPPPAEGKPSPGERQREREIWSRFAQIDSDAAAISREIWERMPPDLGFHTHEWRTLIFNIHRRLEPTAMARELVEHLDHCRRFAMLPTPLRGVYEDPERFVTALITRLPVHDSDPTYCNQLVARTVELLESAARELDRTEQADHEETRADPDNRQEAAT